MFPRAYECLLDLKLRVDDYQCFNGCGNASLPCTKLFTSRISAVFDILRLQERVSVIRNNICDYGFQRFHGCRNMHISFAKMLTACVGAIPDILRVQERASTIRKMLY